MTLPSIRSSAAYVNDQIIQLESFPTRYPVWNREMDCLLQAMGVYDLAPSNRPFSQEDMLYVGCGRRLPFLNCWCVDLDPRVGDGIPHFLHADALDLPFESDRFPFVLSSHTLEHLSDCHAALLEQARVTKVGGVVGAIIPDVRWTRGSDPTHVREWSLEEFVRTFPVVEQNGVKLVLHDSGVAELNYSFFVVFERS